MANYGISRTGGRGASRLIVFCVLLGVPAWALAQDNRIDDSPESSAQGASGAPPPGGSTGLLTEPKMLSKNIQRAIDKFGESRQAREKNGLYLETSNMITGSGFVAAGPGYRRYMFNKQAFFDTSAAVSWHLYTMMQGRFEAPQLANNHLTLGVQTMWQDSTQVNYFGIGSNSIDADQSQYQLRTLDVVGYAAVRPHDWLTYSGEVGWLHRPNVLAPGGTFKPGFPDTSEEFPNDPGTTLPFQPNFLHGEAAVAADNRDYRSHPTKGGLYRAALTTYSDQSTGTFSFRQYEAEAAKFVRMGSPKWILAFRGWVLVSDVPNGHEIPFYLIPSLGGQDTLRSYSNFRFHDQDLLLVNAESRWALFEHVDGAVFFDAGNVAPRAGDLNLDKTSVGAGLRLHTKSSTWGRLDVAHGAEGWQFVLRTSDPLRLARVTRRVAGVPFVP
jgi:Omp85 superfamily domain